MQPKCQVILSDLPEAMDLIDCNIADSRSAVGSRVSSLVLDWDQDLPKTITAQNFDLILVCDCTYNSDSIPALVKTLSTLAARTPAALIVMATKVRHVDEIIFFDLMHRAGLVEAEHQAVSLHNEHAAFNDQHQTIDIYVYRGKGIHVPAAADLE